jgi:hypothetical protein
LQQPVIRGPAGGLDVFVGELVELPERSGGLGAEVPPDQIADNPVDSDVPSSTSFACSAIVKKSDPSLLSA